MGREGEVADGESCHPIPTPFPSSLNPSRPSPLPFRSGVASHAHAHAPHPAAVVGKQPRTAQTLVSQPTKNPVAVDPPALAGER